MSQNPDFDFSNIGRQVRDTVKSAVQSPKFADIRQTISSTAREIQWTFKSGFQPPQESGPQPPAAASSVSRPASRPARAAVRIPGKVSGILLTVFSGIGLGAFLICTVLFLFAFVSTYDSVFGQLSAAMLVCFALLTLACVILLLVGGSLRRRARRFRLILEQLGNCAFCPVDLLASHTGQTVRDTVRDLRRMIAMGILPDGHLDDEETCVMLNYETYQYYQQAKRREREEQEAKAKEAAASAADKDGPAAVIAEGRALLRQIRECNDALPGEEISAKLTRLENTTAAIFRYVEENPEKLPEIRRFLNYYLPTTLKLLDAYRKFEEQPVHSGQQAETQAQIEGALDTINEAFVRLLDGLMQTQRMDVSADISVMKTMLEKEGLTGDPISGHKPE